MDKIRVFAKEKGLLDIGTITREEFLDLYRREGKTKLSRRFGCSKQVMMDKIRQWDIPSLDKIDRINLRCPGEFTEEQEDVLYGSLLGDGHISRARKVSRFKETHCLQQKGYLEWKHKILFPFSSPITSEDKEMPSGYLSRCFGFHTCFHSLFTEFHDKFYEGRAKRLPEDFEEKINGRILAVWYMDDGHLDDFYHKGQVQIASSFLPDEIIRIVNRLNEMGLNVVNVFRPNETKGINILKIHNIDKFFELTKEYIHGCLLYKVPLRLGGKEKKDIDPSDLQGWFDFLKHYGMVYPHLSSVSFATDMKGLVTSGVEIENDEINAFSICGSKTCLSVFDNIFKAKRKGKKSPIEIFSDEKMLRHCLGDCLKFYGEITDANLRQELRSFGGVNNFKPVLAKWIYNEFCPLGGRVLDPCSGWGGRLCGFMSSTAKSYTGIDVEPESVKNLKKLYEKMESFFPDKIFENHRCDFGEFETDSKFDLVFTSPPYFDAEWYGDSVDQSSFKYHTYDGWRLGFLKELIDKSWRFLDVGGRIILNVPSKSEYPIYEDVKTFMKVEREMKIKMKGRYGKGEKFEWLLVSEKKN